MSLFVAYGRTSLSADARPPSSLSPHGTGPETVFSDEQTLVCTASTNRSDVDVDTDAPDGAAAVFGDALRGTDRFRAADVDALAPEAFDSVNGEFAGVAVRDEGVRLVTDRVNLKQLFCFRSDDLLVAASRVLPIVEFLHSVGRAGELSLDRTAFSEFLTFGHVLQERTYLNEIRLLPAATTVSVTAGDAGLERTDHRYWELEYGDYYESQAEAVERLTDALSTAVQRRVATDARNGLHLSGGLDSRLILGAVPSAVDFTGYTFGVSRSDEVALARLSARAVGRDCRWYPIEPYIAEHGAEGVRLTDGFVAANSFHHVPSMPDLATRCDRLFLGTSLDVFLEGSMLTDDMVDGQYSATQLYDDQADFDPELWTDLFATTDGFDSDRAEASLRESYDAVSLDDHCNRADVWNLRNRQARWIFTGGPRSIATHLPVSNPLGDSNLLEAMLRLPPEMRAATDVRNEMLSRLNRRLALVPYANTWAPPAYPQVSTLTGVLRLVAGSKTLRRTVPLTGDEIRFGRSYPDYAEWLRTDEEFYEYTEEKLRAFADRGYCDLGAAIKALEQHRLAETSYIDELMRIVTLEVWLETVADEYLTDTEQPERVLQNPT